MLCPALQGLATAMFTGVGGGLGGLLGGLLQQQAWGWATTWAASSALVAGELQRGGHSPLPHRFALPG